jgi:hypothetical protein
MVSLFYYEAEMLGIDERIGKLKGEIDELEKKKEKFSKLTPAQQLTISLHNRFCRLTHEDRCGWSFNTDRVGIPQNWLDPTTEYWFKKATAILNSLKTEIDIDASDENCVGMIEAIIKHLSEISSCLTMKERC